MPISALLRRVLHLQQRLKDCGLSSAPENLVIIHDQTGAALGSAGPDEVLPASGVAYVFDVAQLGQNDESALPGSDMHVAAAPSTEANISTSDFLFPHGTLGQVFELSKQHETAGAILSPAVSLVTQLLVQCAALKTAARQTNSVLESANTVAQASNTARLSLRALHGSASSQVQSIRSSVDSLQGTANHFQGRFSTYMERLQAVKLHPCLPSADGQTTRLSDIVDVAAATHSAASTWQSTSSIVAACAELSAELARYRQQVQSTLDMPIVPPNTVERVKQVLEDAPACKAAIAGVHKATLQAWEPIAQSILELLQPAQGAASGAGLDAMLEKVERFRLSLAGQHDDALAAARGRMHDIHHRARQCLADVQAQQKVILRQVGALQAGIAGSLAQCRVARAQIDEWRRGLQAVSNLRNLPLAYNAAIHEVARRRAYGRLLHARVQSMVSVLEASASREAGRRRRFDQKHGFLLPEGLIPGLDAPEPRVHLSAALHDEALPEIDNVPTSMGGVTASANHGIPPSPLMGGLTGPQQGMPLLPAASSSMSSSGSGGQAAGVGAPQLTDTPATVGSGDPSAATHASPLGSASMGSMPALQGHMSTLSLGPSVADAPTTGTTHASGVTAISASARSLDESSSPQLSSMSVSPLLHALSSAVARSNGILDDGSAPATRHEARSSTDSVPVPAARSGTNNTSSSTSTSSASVLGAHQSLILRLREVEADNAQLRARMASMTATRGRREDSEPQSPSATSAHSKASIVAVSDGANLAAVQRSLCSALRSTNIPVLLDVFQNTVNKALSDQDKEDVARVRRQLQETVQEAEGDLSPPLPVKQRSAASEAVWSTTSQLCRLLSYSMGVLRQSEQQAAASVVYNGFSPGVQAMFLRVPWPLKNVQGSGDGGEDSPPRVQWQYVAFNINAPHHYVDGTCLPQEVQTSLPDFVVLHVSSVGAFVASASFNPYGVQPGTQFFSVQGSVVHTGAALSRDATSPDYVQSASGATPPVSLAPLHEQSEGGHTGGSSTSWGEAAAASPHLSSRQASPFQ